MIASYRLVIVSLYHHYLVRSYDGSSIDMCHFFFIMGHYQREGDLAVFRGFSTLHNGVVPEIAPHYFSLYGPWHLFWFYCLLLAVGYGCRLSIGNSFIIPPSSGEELRWLEYWHVGDIFIMGHYQQKGDLDDFHVFLRLPPCNWSCSRWFNF